MMNKIFKLLPLARRKELEREALSMLIGGILRRNQGKTFETLIKDLMKSKHWSFMKDVKVSSVIVPR